jgi:hypothetical protein
MAIFEKGEIYVNPDVITIQDCLDMYDKKGQAVLIAAGKVVGFIDSGKDEG